MHASSPTRSVRPLLRITRPSRSGATTARPTCGVDSGRRLDLAPGPPSALKAWSTSSVRIQPSESADFADGPIGPFGAGFALFAGFFSPGWPGAYGAKSASSQISALQIHVLTRGRIEQLDAIIALPEGDSASIMGPG